MPERRRIAHLSGSNATIQNSPPLVTSNKARSKYGLPLLAGQGGGPLGQDIVRSQRLAAPAKLYVEAYSAHPLEADAAELYAPPDGFLDAGGHFHHERTGPADRPVYEVEIAPEDGLYMLPYMARQSDGSAWEGDTATNGQSRQPFYPDGSRPFEEVDRFGLDERGWSSPIGRQAEVDYYRILPPGGYAKGLPEDRRTDVGAGDIPPERNGMDFFPYRPAPLTTAPKRGALADIVNEVQAILGSGAYDGAIWTQGSGRVEETLYWFNLLLDIRVPVCGVAGQRPHGSLSADGPRNILDGVDYICNGPWAGPDGADRVGAVAIQDQLIFTAREIAKLDSRPGGYEATGGSGGILGQVGHGSRPTLEFLPTRAHTWRSRLRVTQLPEQISGVALRDGRLADMPVPVRASDGSLLRSAIPKVSILKDGCYAEDDGPEEDPMSDVFALMDDKLRRFPLAGFVMEGLAPYGKPASDARGTALRQAIFSGLPVVCTGRGNVGGYAHATGFYIGGSNLTAPKARLLLMACLMMFGSLPFAADPAAPTAAEQAATRRKLALYQEIFDSH